MTFPDKKYDGIGAFFDAYMTMYQHAAKSVDQQQMAMAADLLTNCYQRSGTLFSCGNGGSAAISNHLVCDHLKGCRTDTDFRPRVVSLSSNIETITAVGNDIGFEDIFRYQLSSLATSGDVLITISSSGDSENIVRTVDWALQNDLQVIAMTGFDGGRTANMATVNLHVNAHNYGIVEDAHQSLMHILAQYIRLQKMDASLVPKRKF